MSESTMRLLAAAAHLCWCEQMREDGWGSGDRYSLTHRTHDAIVPFDMLSKSDQRLTLRALRCEETAAYLAQLLDYPRNEPGLPELQPEDMKVGIEVEMVPELRASLPADRSGRGKILSWLLNDATGDLDLVRIRWDDGTESEHTPGERELILVSASDSRA
jgi:hypothetical protein